MSSVLVRTILILNVLNGVVLVRIIDSEENVLSSEPIIVLAQPLFLAVYGFLSLSLQKCSQSLSKSRLVFSTFLSFCGHPNYHYNKE
ncbi:hypothetical protein TorRG33x02_346010, partial [Trema orientale]